MNPRAEALHRVDVALAEISALEAVLAAARQAQHPWAHRGDVVRRFHAIAEAGAGHDGFVKVRELAALAEKITGRTDPGIPRTAGELEVVQHAADVLSLLLRDMGHRLLGRRGADVAPAAAALRDRLEHMLMAAHR